MKLYICMTYYHTLITMIKSLVEGEKPIVLVADNIPNHKDLIGRMQTTDCFEKVYEYGESMILKDAVYKNRFAGLLLQHSLLKKAVERHIPIDLHDNYEIYIYHDYSKMGKYIVQEGVKYHLIEDALDYFQYFDEYYKVKEDSFHDNNLKAWMKKRLNLGYQLWGTSPNCIDIEVNKIEGIKISHDKVIELPRKELFGKLDEQQKNFVYNTYAAGKDLRGKSGKTAIVCTQPLFVAKHVPTMKDQMDVFEAILKKFSSEGYQIVIKPHPRDMADYSGLVEKYECSFIDKNLPSEILNYNQDTRYDVAVSVTSTAINFLECADKKIFMGMDYLEKVLKKNEFKKQNCE